MHGRRGHRSVRPTRDGDARAQTPIRGVCGRTRLVSEDVDGERPRVGHGRQALRGTRPTHGSLAAMRPLDGDGPTRPAPSTNPGRGPLSRLRPGTRPCRSPLTRPRTRPGRGPLSWARSRPGRRPLPRSRSRPRPRPPRHPATRHSRCVAHRAGSVVGRAQVGVAGQWAGTWDSAGAAKGSGAPDASRRSRRTGQCETISR